MATANIYGGAAYLGADLYGDMSPNEQSGVLTGGASGAALGFTMGGPVGAVVGFGIGAGLGYLQGDSADDAAEEEAARLEAARIDAINREFGIMKSKQNMALANANNRGRSNQAQNNSGNIDSAQALNESGFIGQNIVNTGGTGGTASSAGTF